MDNLCLVKAKDISIQFGDRQVLQEVSLSVPQSGSIEKPKNLRIGYMPQKLHIEPTMPITVKRFLELARHTRASPIDAILDEVQIKHLMDHQLRSISGGEMQRVLLARALSQTPQLLVLKESTWQGKQICTN